ncbi:MAG: hypothetical protein KGZ25_03325 [Planctomycetes bacterium]|nr:hypothetical protein [Planctomycetota bacterium]
MKMVRDATILLVACFFALMWGLYLREHIPTETGTTLKPDYESLLPEGQTKRKTVMGIYMSGERRGKTVTEVKKTESGTITVESLTQLELGDLKKIIIPGGKTVDVNFRATISPLTGLRTISLTSKSLGTSLLGRRQEGVLKLDGNVAGQKIHSKVPFESEPVLSQTFSPLAGLPDLGRVDEGRVWTIHVVNPLLGSVKSVKIRHAKIQNVTVDGEQYQLHRLDMKMGTHIWKAWVRPDGEVLYQGTPFGLSLLRENIGKDWQQALGKVMGTKPGY